MWIRGLPRVAWRQHSIFVGSGAAVVVEGRCLRGHSESESGGRVRADRPQSTARGHLRSGIEPAGIVVLGGG
eukprot:5155025-Alexandrium_andersonii.AAC.1